MPNRVVYPGATVGILGGGQLGRMMAMEGRKLGYRFATLDPTPHSPCGQVADLELTASYSDVAAARQLAQASDVITYEFENVDVAVAGILEAQSDVPQGSQLLRTTQHRIREKRAIEAAGAPVASYVAVASRADFDRALTELGLPAVLKTTMGGYDGKGQWVIRDVSGADAIWRECQGVRFGRAEAAESAEAPLIVEQFVPFEQELSVIVARARHGEIVSFPVAENIHVNHILHLSVVPARIHPEIQQRARRLAEQIAESMAVVGLLAVEMFVASDGQLFINELAPRPHNSGHYTLDACVTSQFEQHIRAICGLPLGSPKLLNPVVMVNVLGEHVQPLMDRFPSLRPQMKVHLYGKVDAKPGRKMGHVNVLADDVEQAIADIRAFGVWM